MIFFLDIDRIGGRSRILQSAG